MAAWAAICFFKVYQSSDPTGGDGYFYLKQIDWLADHFQFYHADYSFFFLPTALIYKIAGSSLLAYQIVTSFSLFLMTTSLGLIFLDQISWVQSRAVRIIISVVFALVVAMQACTLKLSFEFAKNGLAQGFLLFGIYLYLEKHYKTCLVFFLLAALTHKLMILFLLLFGFFKLVDLYRWRKPSLKMAMIGLTFFCLSILAALIVFPRLAKHIQNFYDHFYIEKTFFMYFENQLVARPLIALTFFWLLLGCFFLLKRKSALFSTLIFSALLPFLPLFAGYNIEIKYRLFLQSFTFAAIVFAGSLPFIKKQKLQVGLVFLSLVLLSYEATTYSGFPWIMNWSDKIRNLDQLNQHVAATDELVTHHGLQFYIDYKTPIRARSMVAQNRKPRYQIAFTPAFYHLNADLSDEIRQIEILSLGSSYGLFEYDDFQSLMKQFPMLSDWRNQFQVRPDFVQDY